MADQSSDFKPEDNAATMEDQDYGQLIRFRVLHFQCHQAADYKYLMHSFQEHSQQQASYR